MGAALEVRVGFLGKVGADGLGQRLEEVLLRHGVTSHLSRSVACMTGTSVKLTSADGHRHFLSALPNSEVLSFADLDLTPLHGYDHAPS